MFWSVQFLHPEFLYGLFLLAIPILLHLFSLKKYKKVYFSNFRFLEALQQQKKNSSKLKNLLLLFLRLLVITCLVLAFATPYITPEHQSLPHTEKSQIIVYIDNSFSMSNSGAQGNLFDEAKKHLFDIVSAYPRNTSFRLLTNDAPTDLILTKEQALQVVGQLKITPARKPLSQIYKEAREFSQNQPATLFLLSDFQKNNCDFQHITQDSTLESIYFILKPENLNNLYIKEVAFEQPFHQKNQNDKIKITIANASKKDYQNIPVVLTINGKKKSISQIDLPAQGEKELTISYLNSEDGAYKGIVEITDFPLIFDNQFFFSYSINNMPEILYIWQTAPNVYFSKLFSDSTAFRFFSAPVNQTANLNLSRYNLVILDGLTNSSNGTESIWEDYLINGGNLFILPGERSVENQNRFLQKLQAPAFGPPDTNTLISRIETQAALFREVFAQEDKRAVLPRIHQYFPLAGPGEVLLQDKRNHTLLATKSLGKGNIYVSAFNFSPDNSDLVFHPLFVPLMANMACQVNSALNTSYFLQTDKPVTINSKNYIENLPLQIRSDDQSFEFIPEIRKDFSGELVLTNPDHIQEAGIYEVLQEEKITDMLAWNYNRSESQMEFCTEAELNTYLPDARIANLKTTHTDQNSQLVKEMVLQDNNKYLTFWFLLATVIALLLEQWIWKRKLN